MVAWAAMRLVCMLIDWQARVGYERARAASVVDVLRALPAGGTVYDIRADGTVLRIGIPVGGDLPLGTQNEARGDPC
jgi:hypothetical protein